jgi:internalin A
MVKSQLKSSAQTQVKAAVGSKVGETKVTFCGKTYDLKTTEVVCISQGVKDADLQVLAQFKNLRTLRLANIDTPDSEDSDLETKYNYINGTGLAYLARSETLTELDLSDASVRDMKHIGRLKGLQRLNLGTSDLGASQSLEHLRGLKALKVLNLRGRTPTSAGIDVLLSLKSLRSLILSAGSRVQVIRFGRRRGMAIDQSVGGATNGVLKRLARFRSLESLDLTGTKVTDWGLKYLARLKRLQNLDLTGTKVTDAGLKRLAKLKELQKLDLTWTKVTDQGVENLKKAMPGLEVYH